MWTNNDKTSRYEIRQDETVGYYLYRFDREGKCTHDYLQDTLDAAMGLASREFGLNRTDWEEVPEKTAQSVGLVLKEDCEDEM